MNLHEVLTEMGSKHCRVNGRGYSDLFTIDLERKTIKNGNILLVDNGKIIPQLLEFDDGSEVYLDDDFGLVDEDFYNGLEKRYVEYYLSCPTETDRFVRSNFIAQDVNKMTYEQFMKGGKRNATRYELDWFVLANAIAKKIEWKDGKHWYWQSKENPTLILYKTYL